MDDTNILFFFGLTTDEEQNEDDDNMPVAYVSTSGKHPKPRIYINKTPTDDAEKYTEEDQEIIIDQFNELMPIFFDNSDECQNITISILAPKGAGKSFFCAEILKDLLILNPKKKIIIVSNSHDPAFVGIGENVFFMDVNQFIDNTPKARGRPKKIKETKKKKKGKKTKKTEETEDEGEEMEEIKDASAELKNKINTLLNVQTHKNSIIVFDDWQTADKETNKLINNFKHQCFTQGRKHGVDCISIYQKILSHWDTTDELTQSDYVVLFPFASNHNELFHFFKRYMGIENKRFINGLKNLNTRWMVVRMKVPKYYIYKNGVKII